MAEHVAGHDGFVAVAAEDELWDGEMESYRVGGVEVLLIRLDGQYHAYLGSCPHQSSALVEGDLDGGTLTCWAHQWIFDAVTGAGINPRTACLTRYAVRVSEGQVWVSREPVMSTASRQRASIAGPAQAVTRPPLEAAGPRSGTSAEASK